jgi:hypothetical protein|tara:strand:+ start:658 stop:837 length:180 start_codon:yes stop_codon:yes gene_type:complete
MLKLKREFAGFYIIKGHSRDYEITISKDVNPKYWRCDGHYFSSLADAKAFMFVELSEEI